MTKTRWYWHLGDQLLVGAYYDSEAEARARIQANDFTLTEIAGVMTAERGGLRLFLTHRLEDVPVAPNLGIGGEEPGRATKDTNPKDAIGVTKSPVSTVPAYVVAELGLAMLEGALKYGRHNYRVTGVRASVYFDALRRHIDDWWEGVDFDADSAANLSNLTKAIACLTVLRDAQMQGKLTDDRPPPSPQGTRERLNVVTKQLLEAFPDPKPPHTR